MKSRAQQTVQFLSEREECGYKSSSSWYSSTAHLKTATSVSNSKASFVVHNGIPRTFGPGRLSRGGWWLWEVSNEGLRTLTMIHKQLSYIFACRLSSIAVQRRHPSYVEEITLTYRSWWIRSSRWHLDYLVGSTKRTSSLSLSLTDCDCRNE
jgi:hypothetical protein